MSQQLIGIGSANNDGTGDPLRTGGMKINANFTELYTNAVISVSVTVGNSTVNSFVNSTAIVVSSIVANGSVGTNNASMTSNGSGVFWSPQVFNIANPIVSQALVYDSSGFFINSNKVDLPCGGQISVNGSVTINRANGEFQRISLTGDAVINVSSWPTSNQVARLTLEIENTGSFDITGWPPGTVWPGGSAPTITTGGSGKDLIVLMSFNGGSTIYGTVAGQAYS
jgi:hypothetical protein